MKRPSLSLFLALFAFSLFANQENRIIADEFEGIKFEVPFQVEKRTFGKFEGLRFDLDSCQYSYLIGENNELFFQKDDIVKYYKKASQAISTKFADSKIIDQQIIDISNKIAINNTIEFYEDSTWQVFNLVILVVKSNYYSFQIIHKDGLECNEEYNMQKVIESIQIVDETSKSQFTSKIIPFISNQNRSIVVICTLLLILLIAVFAYYSFNLFLSALGFSIVLFLTETSQLATFFDSSSGAFLRFIIVFFSLLIISYFYQKNLRSNKYLQRVWKTLEIGLMGISLFVIFSWFYYGIYHIDTQPFLFGATDRIPMIFALAIVKSLEVIFTSLFSFRLKKH